MAYKNSTGGATILATVGFDTVDDTALVPLGTIAKGIDPTYGEGEFVYVQGLASVAVGEQVAYDQRSGQAGVRTVVATRGPVGYAMAAIVAGKFGWLQIGGSAIVKAGTVAAGTPVYASATAGTVDDAVAATGKVEGATFKTADGTPAAGQAIVQCQRPSMNGNG